MDFYGWEKVQRVDGLDKCWEWLGNRDKANYGTMMVDGKNWRSNRLAVRRWHSEPLVGELYVLHRCDNPPCINPDHLYQGTKQQNSQDMARRRRGNTVRLTEDAVIDSRMRAAAGERVTDLAKEYGVSKTAMAYAVSGKTWKWLQEGSK